MRTSLIALAGLLVASTAAAALDRYPPGHPLLDILAQADVLGTGYVTRSAADAAVEARARDDLRETRLAWNRLVGFAGLPPDAKAFRPGQVVSAYLRLLGEADTDGDGDVTRAEMTARIAREPDEAQRRDLAETTALLSSGPGGTVTRAERDAMAKADPGPVETLADKLADVEAKRAFEAGLVAKAFASAGDAEGRVRIRDVTAPSGPPQGRPPAANPRAAPERP